MLRKSFIIHFDSLDVLEELTDEQAGQLFKAMSEYQKTGKNTLSGVLKAVFIPFKNQFDRDDEKYQSICERNKNNGLKGGRPKPTETQSVILGFKNNPDKPKRTQANPKEPDNKNKNDSKNKKEEEQLYFSGDVIKLNKKDYKAWEAMTGYSEDYFFKLLSERDDWLADNPDKSRNWFMSTKTYLERLGTAS